MFCNLKLLIYTKPEKYILVYSRILLGFSQNMPASKAYPFRQNVDGVRLGSVGFFFAVERVKFYQKATGMI